MGDAIGGARVAVIGCGYWGKNLVRNFAALGALHMICDISAETLLQQAESVPGVRWTTELDDVLTDPQISGVVIASPAANHFEHGMAAIKAGKDVFVEKPLALTYSQGARLVDAALESERILMVGHVLEYHPAVDALKSIVASGDLGELRYIYSNRLNLGKVRQEENILWSFAPHDISIMTSIAGSAPLSAASSGGTYLRPDVHDVTVTALSFPGHVRGHIFVSWLHPYKEQRLAVVGSRKMAVFDDTVKEGKLRLYDKGFDWDGNVPVARDLADRVIEIEPAEPLRRECAHFLHCMRTRETPLTGPENALRVLAVLEASQLSLDRGGIPVELGEVMEAFAVG